jgi:alpha-mannosidase
VPEEWSDVSLELADGTRVATQELDRNTPVLSSAALPGREIPEFLHRRVHGRELFHRWLNGFTLEPGPRLVFDLDTEQDPLDLDLVELRTAIEVAANAQPDDKWEVVMRTRPRRWLLARAGAPVLGWAAARAVEGRVAQSHEVTARADALENGLVRVEIDEDGTLRVGDLEGVGRIVRGLDVGDSYNYGPPAGDVLVDLPEAVRVEIREEGPIRAVAAVTRTYKWSPDHVVETETLVELRADEPFVRLRISFDNPADDQRVRVHVPLPREADRSFAEGQYAVVERALHAEGGYGEVPLPTFPAASFAAAGGVALLLEHVSEYEVLDGRELALTVLRSTGLISRNEHPYREDPAGPEVPIPDAQMRGRHSFGFALYPYEGVRPGPDVLEQAECFRLPFLALPGEGAAGELASAEGLPLEGEGVALTALRRVGEGLEARVVNETPEPRTVRVAGEQLELRPWEIRTAMPTTG